VWKHATERGRKACLIRSESNMTTMGSMAMGGMVSGYLAQKNPPAPSKDPPRTLGKRPTVGSQRGAFLVSEASPVTSPTFSKSTRASNLFFYAFCRSLFAAQSLGVFSLSGTCAVQQPNSGSTCRRRIEVKLGRHLLGGTRRGLPLSYARLSMR